MDAIDVVAPAAAVVTGVGFLVSMGVLVSTGLAGTNGMGLAGARVVVVAVVCLTSIIVTSRSPGDL
ncbi:MAG TPA: hypothetical protein VM260_19860, partial [Pirellula sp.]|nr:hypothetical protein [Pirellula sp.]